MKGDYTREAEITCSTKGQHYPQMKGDYTIGFTSSIVFDGQHYPQIKGDYTQVWILPFKGSSPTSMQFLAEEHQCNMYWRDTGVC